MKAMLLINENSGNGRIVSIIDLILISLKKKYKTIDYFICQKEEEFISHAIDSCGHYDALIFAGGDGTFHLIINALAKQNDVPILGILPCGTLNDAAKNFGVNKNIKNALKIILEGQTKTIDICQINNDFFVFEASIGAYADIPLKTSQKLKKRFGHLSYYFKAVPQMFKLRSCNFKLTLSNQNSIYIETPFLLIMNSAYMGGFKLNRKSNMNDGMFDVFYSKVEPFNGLLSYLFFKKRLVHFKTDYLKVEIDAIDNWDLDGEKGQKGNAEIHVIPHAFKVFSKK